MAENITKTEKNVDEISSSNIFDDFDTQTELKSEVEQIEIQNEKDMYFYLSKGWKIFQQIFILVSFILVLVFFYIFIQNDENKKEIWYLNQICFLFTDDLQENQACSSILSLKTVKTKELDLLKSNLVSEMITILSALYQVENFNSSKEVSFLSYKSENKLLVTEIISKFNDLMLWFASVERDKLQCKNFSIDSKNKTISADCIAYTSSEFEEKTLMWRQWTKSDEKMSWTSISLASSFLNYIEKQSTDFTLKDKQKTFSKELVSWDIIWFTYKTSIKLTLKYNF